MASGPGNPGALELHMSAIGPYINVAKYCCRPHRKRLDVCVASPQARHRAMQPSEELREAAETLSKSPASLQLRYLQTLLELGADQNSTVVFPLPVDIITPFLRNPEILLGLSALRKDNSNHRG